MVVAWSNLNRNVHGMQTSAAAQTAQRLMRLMAQRAKTAPTSYRHVEWEMVKRTCDS